MINGKKVLGIVPARAGSKGLPGKNYRILHDKPLISYSIDAGLNSNYIDEVILTSNCSTCIEIAKKTNVMVPFVRPSHLSDDKVPSSDVIDHVINYLRDKGFEYDLFVLLEPTSPLRDSEDVDKAIEYMMNKNFRSLVSVCEAEDQHPTFMFKLKETGELSTWSANEFQAVRRQDVSPAYFLEGSIYISYIEEFLQKRTFCHDMTGGFIVPKWKAFEIDDIVDFICVEAIMSKKHLIKEFSN